MLEVSYTLAIKRSADDGRLQCSLFRVKGSATLGLSGKMRNHGHSRVSFGVILALEFRHRRRRLGGQEASAPPPKKKKNSEANIFRAIIM